MPAPGGKIKAMVERIAVDQFRREGGEFVLWVTGLPADAVPLLALRRCRLRRLDDVSEDGGLDEVENPSSPLASCSLRTSNGALDSFNVASWASNFACSADSLGKTSVPWVS